MTDERINPMAGPAHVMALKNKIEKRVMEYCTPPKTSGTQVSIRLDDFLLNHVEAIVALSGWNRSEVVYALAHRGLYDLYHYSPGIAEAVVQQIMGKMAPPQPPVP